MLDAKSLEVLNSLKTEIKSSKTVLKGQIKGTGKSFGFVVSEQDGQEYFLPPDEMKRVFPGDSVTFTVVELEDGKTKAELESLVSSSLDEFNGVFHVRGKAQGIEPFDDNFNGWLFVPPKQIADAEHNHIVQAKVTRHPWEQGKAQASIIRSLGSAKNNRTWYSMTLAQYGIAEQFPSDVLTETAAITDTGAIIPEQYADFTSLPFVTIDSATTEDMDDALYAEACADGWKLSVAIADASLYIKPEMALDREARKRLTTTYLPGLTLPMLPEALSNNLLSLMPGEVRPAVVFELSVNPNGDVSTLNITLAKIQSAGKLAYDDVAEWLAAEQIPPAHKNNLSALRDVCDALAKRRQDSTATVHNRVDYRIRVDEKFNVTTIDIEQRNSARDLVEEAMIATNRAVAQWLADTPALFMAHAGFKPDRESELKGLLREYAPEVAELDATKLENFIAILQQANLTESFPLTKVLQKRFDRGYWSAQAAAHFGLGFSQYTTATSPIRKYSDLLIHRLLKSRLLNKNDGPINQAIVDDFNERANASRQAAQAIENRLRLSWLSQQPKQSWHGTIVHINANTLIIQLTDNGATGIVDLRKAKPPFSYDPLRMQLKSEQRHYRLADAVQVTIEKASADQLVLTIDQKDGSTVSK